MGHLVSKDCREKYPGYYKKCNIIISNFYEIVDSYNIDIDADDYADEVAILSPKSRIITRLDNICEEDTLSNRFLLIALKDTTYIFNNVIRNELGFASIGTEHIEKIDSGFNMSYQFGQSCYFQYTINVRFIERNFYIDNIIIRKGCPGESDSTKEYQYSKYEILLSKYKRTMIDSLRNTNNW
ncbi:MAG: hypothetical protein ACO1PI_05810 [Bacteroidota bacterium]